MSHDPYEKLLQTLNEAAEPVVDGADKYSTLLEKIGDARFVLIGEATHGTQEFYQTRAEITQELISKKGFMAVAIEGDWPDAYQVNRYLHGFGNPEDAEKSLGAFKRFPTWMWNNTTLPPFLQWLREHNDKLADPNKKINFYGLDLYSLYTSIQRVITYLEKIDPPAAKQAKARYACFDHLQTDPQSYGYLTTAGIKKACIDEAVQQLMELQHTSFAYLRQDGVAAEDENFFATQNARVIKNAEVYYRSMFEDNALSWNVRDKHMTETLNVIENHLEHRHHQPAKIVVWAHNSHVGDARATEMSERGEINIGQLMREQHGSDAYLLGFSTYQGYVTAASNWGEAAEHKKITQGFESSYEEIFHHMKFKNFLLDIRANPQLEHILKIPRLQRAIGVIYRPETERLSHYFFTRLCYQFDSIIHFDETTAVRPCLNK